MERRKNYSKWCDQLVLANELLRTELAFEQDYSRKRQILKNLERLRDQINDYHYLNKTIESGYEVFSQVKISYVGVLDNYN